jgi:cytochrome c oxidase cbb3-type subunit III
VTPTGLGSKAMNWKRDSPHSKVGRVSLWLAVGSYCLFWVTCMRSQQQPPRLSVNEPQAESRSSAEGRRSFEARCAPCHGLDGRGGERAPNIATRPSVQRQPDARIFRIIQDGVPETGMPSFATLDAARINALVKYLRLLQGKTATAPVAGDPRNGKTLFFGQAWCSECHLIEGQGGFIASDLSIFGRTHSTDEMRDAITNPNKAGDPSTGMALVITRDGGKYSGMVRNEDNFSLQLQAVDGGFYLFLKSDLENVTRQPESLMPSTYGSTLSRAELDDIASFLMTAARDRKPDAAPKKKSSKTTKDE